MSGFRRCQGCNRRLTDVFFCTQCGGWFCCPGCLARDIDRHAKAALVSPAIVAADTARSEGQTVLLGLVSTSQSHGRLPAIRLRRQQTRVGQQKSEVVEIHRLGEVGVETRLL
jgi:hypothetical protein